MSDAGEETAVLIVGAGPTGLCLACGLARQGVPFRLIDAKAGPSSLVKASEVTPRSLEILADFGLAEEALALGVAVHSFKMLAHGKVVWEKSYGEIDSPYKFQLHLGQVYVERLLIEDLERRGHRVEWRHSLLDLTDDGKAVTARLSDADGGEEETSVAWLAGCDGAGSQVRKLLGEELAGHSYEADNLIGNVKLDWDRPHDEVYVFFSEEGEMTVNPLPDGWHQINGAFRLEPGAPSRKGEAGSLADLQALFDARSSIPGRLSEANRVAYYRVHHRQVARQRIGRAFLLGDAAHLVSPNTGLGMNTGLQDAENLAWKLSLVQKGIAGDALLDSFDEERHGVLKALGQLSDMEEGLYLLKNPVAREIRNHLFTALIGLKPVFERQNRSIAQVDITYRKSSIVRQDMGLPLHWPGQAHLSEGASCPAAWFAFGEGPHAGDRIGDVRYLRDAEGQRLRLYEILEPCRFALLCFLAEADPGETLRQALAEIAAEVGRNAPWIDLHLVVPGAGPEAAMAWPGRISFDPDGLAHRRYGAEGACLYLIRPDKFVGYRALPPSWPALKGYLAEVLLVDPTTRPQA